MSLKPPSPSNLPYQEGDVPVWDGDRFSPSSSASLDFGTGRVVAQATGINATDLASIQAAVTDAGTYGRVYFPEGTYRADNLQPLDGQLWTGPGIIKRPSGGTAANALILISGKTRVTIDLTLDGNLDIVFSGNSNNDTFTATGSLVNVVSSSWVTVKGSHRNNGGNAVRIFDSSNCSASPDVYNCDYGVLIGSGGTAGDPGGSCSDIQVGPCVMSIIGKNGVFTTGRTDSGSSPNPIKRVTVTGVSIFQPGDTGVEIGQGSVDCVVAGVTIDGNNEGYNGILLRDCERISINGFAIRNFAMFANGSDTYYTQGNGIFSWPQYTGTITGVAIANGVISNCSRGVFAQGNNTSFSATDPDTGGAGSAGVVQAGSTISNVTVDGTQTGTVDGATATALNLHGFYIQSVSGWDLSRCTARNCLNNGFMLGDTNTGSSYITNCSVTGCRSENNGNQDLATYYGFYLNGTSSQANVSLNGCRSHDTRSSGKTQDYGFGWNGSGSGSGQMAANARLTDCTGSGHVTGVFNGVGSDMRALGGTITTSAGNPTINADTSIALYTGSGGHTATLPSVVFAGANHRVLLRNNGSGGLTVTRSGSATMVGPTSLAAGAEHLYISDGASNWY